VTIYGALRELRTLLLLIIGSALILSGTLGWFFARTAIRPIGRVVEAAEAVTSARDLQQRVVYRGPPDEIGRLAATFNGMLAELEGAYKALDDSNQRLRQFLADCAHELRAPLTLIHSNLDLLAKVGDRDPAFHTQALADIRAETQRMARMITQLLILSRADAGAHLSAEAIDLADIVADACRQEQGMMGAVCLINTAPRGLRNTVVAGNPDYLKQLFLILIDNAMKYSPPRR
jgi:signal transduction histidine kinase